MTTIIGIQGQEPLTREHYALIFADTQGSVGREDEQKLFCPPNANYVLATAGKILASYFTTIELPRAKQLLSKGLRIEQDDLATLLGQMNELLHEQTGVTNEYLIGMPSPKGPLLLYYAKQGLRAMGAMDVALGSGARYTSALRELDDYKQENRCLLDKRAALTIGMRAMRQAAYYDHERTGRSIDVAIVHADKTVHLPRYATFDKQDDDSFETPPGSQHPWFVD